jgi:hypothetical protein
MEMHLVGTAFKLDTFGNMLRSVIHGLAVVLLLPACVNSSIRSQEGHSCSTDPDEDPQLVCTPAQDLVCISTYTKIVTNPREAPKFDGGLRSVYVCRLNCDTDKECRDNDICCPGHIYGKTYGRKGGCVPPGSCETLPVPDASPPPDTTAPARDTAASPAETGAATPDAAAPVDVPAATPEAGAAG